MIYTRSYKQCYTTEYIDQIFGLGGVTGIALHDDEDDRSNPAWCAFNNQTYYTVDPCNNIRKIYSTNYPCFGKRILCTHNCDKLFCRYVDQKDPEAYHYHS